MATNNAKYLSTLHKQIDQYFSFSEVRTLCFNLGVDYENIPGDHRSAFIRNMIISLAKQGRLQELINEVRAERAFVDWQDVPADFELPSNMAQENIQQVVNYHVYGDYVGGDKISGDKVGGDKISVGNIENARGVAIGGGSSASVSEGAAATERPSPPSPASPLPNLTVPEAVNRINIYLQLISPAKKEAAAELANGIELILELVEKQSVSPLHLKLLCLGQQQLAQALNADADGLDGAVTQFITAVQQQ